MKNGQGNTPRNVSGAKNANGNKSNNNKNTPDNAKVPALIIGGALVGNMIVPGIGGAIVGGIIGGILGSQSNDNKGSK